MSVESVIDTEVRRYRRELERSLLRLALDIQKRYGKGDALGAGLAARIAADLADEYQRAFGEALPGLREGIARVLAEVGDVLKREGVDAQLTKASETTLRMQATKALDELTALGKEGAGALREYAVEYLRTTAEDRPALDALKEHVGGYVGRAVSLVDTTISGIDRKATQAVAEDLGWEWFRYDGPVDDLTRAYCRARVGKVMTLAMLDARPNDTGPQPPSLYCGGWNCRHRLIPLDDAAARRYKRLDGRPWPKR